MRKQLAMAAGVLFALGTAVSGTLSNDTQAMSSATTVESASMDVGSEESAQLLGMLQSHANLAASVPLARPL